MKFENTKVMNFEGAFRGLRNPLESWDKSDSEFGITCLYDTNIDYDVAKCYFPDDYEEQIENKALELRTQGILERGPGDVINYAFLGPKDLDLAHRMIKAGTSDRKFLRQILVSVDITAPLYWYKEFDTYKVGTVANSTSTMHRITSKPIDESCFEMGDVDDSLILYPACDENKDYFLRDMYWLHIQHLETLRQKYIETKDKRYWKELIRWLPNGWLQTRTVTLNYEILRNQYFQRRHHKLVEWHDYCAWIETLPYAADLITYEGK